MAGKHRDVKYGRENARNRRTHEGKAAERARALRKGKGNCGEKHGVEKRKGELRGEARR